MSRLKTYRLAGTMLVLLTIFPLAKLSAQEFNAGVFGGMNASQVDRDGYGGYHNLSFTGGVYVNREFHTDFYWQLELKYEGRGAYYSNSETVEDFNKTSFQYISLPLSVHYLIQEKAQLELGFSPNVLLGFQAYDNQRNQVPLSEPLGGNRRFGLDGFAGFHYWLHSTISVGLRFTYSVIPYSLREGAAVRYLDSGYFHNVLSLTVSYKFLHQ